MQNPTQSPSYSSLPASSIEVENKTKQNNFPASLSTRDIYMRLFWTKRCKWKSVGTTLPIFVFFVVVVLNKNIAHETATTIL